MTTDKAPPGADGASASGQPLALSAQPLALCALSWMIDNNRVAFDRTVDLPAELASADDQITRLLSVIESLRASRIWRLLLLAHQAKRWISGEAAGESIDQWLDKVIALRPAPRARQPVRVLDPETGYPDWIAETEPHLLRHLAGAAFGTDVTASVTVVMPIGTADPRDVAACLATVVPQLGDQHHLIVSCAPGDPGFAGLAAFAAALTVIETPADTTSAQAIALALPTLTSAHVCLLDPRDRLSPFALPIAAAALAADADIDILYADADRLTPAGQRHDPDFRPDWDPDLQRGRDLIGGFTVYRTALLRDGAALHNLSGPAWAYALALRLASARGAAQIRHLPAVLCHRPAAAPELATAMRDAVQAQMAAEARACDVVVVPGPVPALRVRHHLPSPAPGVSLIIPTRDQPDLLAACLDGLLRRTEYSPMEVLLVDNGSTDPRAVAVLDAAARDPRVRVIRQPGPFNWSHLNNVAARQARGDVLVLLNNDTATIDPHWLTEMVSHAIRPEIGAVGAKLLYPDGRVQHAGVAIDDAGGTKHLYRFRRDTDPGPVMALATTRGVTAVTGACLAVRRAMYLEIGGPTETLAIASNDVDLCLRLAARGYRNLWTPFAVVEHRELATRGADTTPEMQARAERELRQLRRDWGGALAREPHLNANLVVVDEDVRLRAGTTAA